MVEKNSQLNKIPLNVGTPLTNCTRANVFSKLPTSKIFNCRIDPDLMKTLIERDGFKMRITQGHLYLGYMCRQIQKFCVINELQ